MIALYILFLLPSDEEVGLCLRQMYRALRNGGVAICQFYNAFASGKTWLSDVMRTGHHISEESASGIRITEISKLQRFDPIHGVGWVKETTVVEAPDGRHVFRDRERFRLFTYWDLARNLEDAGFKSFQCYADWKAKPSGKMKADQLIFVAVK